MVTAEDIWDAVDAVIITAGAEAAIVVGANFPAKAEVAFANIFQEVGN